MGYIIVGTIIGGIIWGVVVNKVIENKGYEENWFWWGFFFGIFALIVALTKQSVNTAKVVIESSSPTNDSMELLSSEILNKQVNISSPAHITSWEIKKDAEKLVLFVDFINVSSKAISAVMISATGFNSFGDIVNVNDSDFFDVIGQDLTINPNEHGEIYAILQDDAIRKVEVKVKKVCFADGTILDTIEENWVSTNQNLLESIHIECAKKYNLQSNYYSIFKENYWQCTCGFVNAGDECIQCTMKKEIALEFTEENIGKTYQKYCEERENENIKSAEEKKIADKQAKKNKKVAIAMLPILLIVISGAVFVNCVVVPEQKYEKATNLYEQEKYSDAYETYKEIINYKDSQSKITEILKEHPILAQPGDFITFGKYEQDNNATNGKEDVEWQVLERDENRLFVISKYVLDVQPYHYVQAPITWEDSSIREWLNNEFINSAFTDDEQEQILWTRIENKDNKEQKTTAGNDTEDRLFLLSVDEVKLYFSTEKDRKILATPFADVANDSEGKGSWWWLRTPGGKPVGEYSNYIKSDEACEVWASGQLDDKYYFGCPVDADDRGVRPSMRIEIID